MSELGEFVSLPLESHETNGTTTHYQSVVSK